MRTSQLMFFVTQRNGFEREGRRCRFVEIFRREAYGRGSSEGT
jgi:hypothetical protein